MTRKNILFTSKPITIGKHEWRILVSEHQLYSTPEGVLTLCTSYQWRCACAPDGQWHEAQEWPAYDHNDTYNGIPRSLMRLYKRELASINRYLNKPDQQCSLF